MLLALGSLRAEAVEETDPVFPWKTIWEQDDTFSSATRVDYDFVKWCRVGSHIFILESATLTDVIHAIGQGSLKGNRRDAAGGEFMVDYTDGKNLIQFSSNAEMGGDTHDLDGIEIRPLTPSEQEMDFPLLKAPLLFPFGNLGMPLNKLKTKLGPATTVMGKVAYFCREKRLIKVSTGEQINYEVDGVLEAKITRGKIAALRIAHLTSN